MRVNTHTIAKLVTLQTGVPFIDLTSHTGRRQVPARARYLVYWGARRSDKPPARRSYAMIGAALGGYDHTTVLKGAQSVDLWIVENPWWREACERLLVTIRGLEQDDPAALALLVMTRHPPQLMMARALMAFHKACRRSKKSVRYKPISETNGGEYAKPSHQSSPHA